MDDQIISILTLLNPIISVIISAITSFFITKYYGERWVLIQRNRKEHSVTLNDGFFKPWLSYFKKEALEYCKIDAFYSIENGKMIPLEPKEPDNLQFYDEAMSHLKNYEQFLTNWGNLKQITLELNEYLAILFEDIRILVKKKVNLPYWCWGDTGDEPEKYLCPDEIVRAIYEEVGGRLKTSRGRYFGVGEIRDVTHGKKISYRFEWRNRYLAYSPDKEVVERIQQLFIQLIEDVGYKEKIKDFMNKQKETYDKALEKVQDDITTIIKSIDLGNIIEGKCEYCPK